jgi:hypothetical protein
MRDRLISLVLALLAIVIFVAMFFQGEKKISSSMPHTEDRGEQGLASFYHWLKARGVLVKSHRRRWHELPAGSGQVLMTHGPYREMDTDRRSWRDSPRSYQEDREGRGIVRWVAMGNTLVVALAAADPDSPEFYQREQERSELQYFRLLHQFGWDTNALATDIDPQVSIAAETMAAAAKSAVDEDTDDSPPRDARKWDVKPAPQTPRSRAAKKPAPDVEPAPVPSTPNPIASDPLKATPAALHQLVLDLPGVAAANAKPITLEYLSWSSQIGQASGMYRYEGESFGRECYPPNQDMDDELIDADDEYASGDSEFDDDEIADDGSVSNAEAPTQPQAVSTESASQQDYSGDQILADGSTLSVTGERIYPLCNPLGLANALPIMRSRRDDSAQGWWVPFGKGNLVVLPYGGLFRNRSLNRPDNASAGEALLRRFQGENAAIYFDDYRYGLSDIYDPEAFYKDPRLYGTVAIAVLLWLMYAVGRRSRLLPVRLPRPRFSSAQLAINLSEFYARKLEPKALAELLLWHFDAALAARYPLDVSESSTLDRVKARLSALNAEPWVLDKLSLLAKGDSNQDLSALLDELAQSLQLPTASAKHGAEPLTLVN